MSESAAPSLFNAACEVFGFAEIARLLARYPQLRRQPRGRGEPVLVLPGFATGDGATVLLRAYLRGLGYRALPWGLGRNQGQLSKLMPLVGDRVAREAARSGTAVQLIGWSLGGYIAREVAREQPEDVAGVITLGSPVKGGPKYTVFAGAYRRRGHDLDAIERRMAERDAEPIRVPLSAIYSKRDAIVSWPACIDDVHAHIRHHEVSARHLGLGYSPEVFERLAQTLAERPPS